MRSLQIRLIGSLNEFLPPNRRDRTIQMVFQGNQTYKHLIESIGVPHPEIAAIQVNDSPGELNQIALENCRLDVYPYPPGDPRIRPASVGFVLDGHLGKLASYMRILGFDVRYHFDANDETLAAISAAENRILLTRDRGLLERKQVLFGYWIRVQDSRQQLLDVVHRYDLMGEIHPFTRCPKCNGSLNAVDKESIAADLLPNTLAFYHQFWQCAECRQVYWQGSHYQHIQNWLNGFWTRS